MPMSAISSSSSKDDPVAAATRFHTGVFIAYVVILALAALFQWWVWSTGNRLQDAIRTNSDARIVEAKAEGAKANERAEKLEKGNLTLKGQVAGLETAASDAKAAQQRVETDLEKQKQVTARAEKDVAGLKKAAAEQQERAANAERAAAEAKLELEDFRAPRSIQDIQSFSTEMKAFSGQKFSLGVAHDQEAFAFAIELRMTLAMGGWVLIPPQNSSAVIDLTGMGDIAGIGNGIGVNVGYAHNPSNEMVLRARALVSALEKHGISAREETSAGYAHDTLNIFVGEKPGRWKWPKRPAKKP